MQFSVLTASPPVGITICNNLTFSGLKIASASLTSIGYGTMVSEQLFCQIGVRYVSGQRPLHVGFLRSQRPSKRCCGSVDGSRKCFSDRCLGSVTRIIHWYRVYLMPPHQIYLHVATHLHIFRKSSRFKSSYENEWLSPSGWWR